MPLLVTNFRSAAVVEELKARIADATTGNKDGIVHNEDKKAGDVSGTSVFDKNPLLFKIRAFLESAPGDEAKVEAFLAGAEQAWGSRVTTLARPSWVKATDWNEFQVDKAITLVRLGRQPGDVADRMVHAAGSVDGNNIAPREIFTQTWKPVGEPNGKTVVIAPGFLETGRNYVEQIQELNKAGYEVQVMDQQWAGLSSKADGGIDRGVGIARDVAAVAADAASRGNHVIIAGTSMGGGPGVTGAVVMNQAGLVKLDGPEMPKDVDYVLQDPYFAKTNSLLNDGLSAVGDVPGVNQIQLPAVGAPVLSSNNVALRFIAQGALEDHLTARAQAFHASDQDLARTKDVAATAKPQGHGEVIHAKNDTLADYDTTKQWAALLGANLTTLDSDSHVLEQNPNEQGQLLAALNRIDAATD